MEDAPEASHEHAEEQNNPQDENLSILAHSKRNGIGGRGQK